MALQLEQTGPQEPSNNFQELVGQLSLPKNYKDLVAFFAEHGQMDRLAPQSFSDALRHWLSKQSIIEKLSYTELEQIERLIEETFDPLWAETQNTRSKLMRALHNSDKDNELHSILEDSAVTQTQLFLKALKLELTRQSQASRDALTGLYNRRYFDEEMNRAIALWKRNNPNPDEVVKQTSHALLLFDLDHFKKVNDSYGHLAGDAALKHFAGILAGIVRKEDVAARWGGEEFVVLLSCKDQDECMLAADRFRKTLKDSEFIYEGQKIPLTVSVGVTVVNGDEPKEIAKRADKAVYAAKEAGRDQVASK